jgi:branched-chain amino acid transport system ATP-binding protein
VKTVYDVLSEVRRTVPMLLVEQSTSAALALAGFGYVLTDGRVALSGTADALGDREALIGAYLGQGRHLEAHPAAGSAGGLNAGC